MGRKNNLIPYELSDNWRCHKAPINPEFYLQVKFNCGAHHWIERWFGNKVGYAFICKWCFDVRKFPKPDFRNPGRAVRVMDVKKLSPE